MTGTHLDLLKWEYVLETNIPCSLFHLQFFADVKEAEERLKKMQENMRKKYTCDRSVTVTRLEDLLQDAMVMCIFMPFINCVLLVKNVVHIF